MLSMRHEVGDRTDEQAALALTGLAQHLPGELMTDAIAIAQSIEDSHHRMKALMALAQCLPDGLFEESFEALIAQAANADGFDALAELGGRMSPPQLEQLLDAIQGVGVVEKRAAIVLRLRGSLSPQAWSSTLGQLLEAARGLACPETRANVLTNLISHVPGEQRNHVLHEAIEAALAIADAESRAKALTRLLFDLSGELQQQIAERAAEALHAIQNNSLQQSQLRAA